MIVKLLHLSNVRSRTTLTKCQFFYPNRERNWSGFYVHMGDVGMPRLTMKMAHSLCKYLQPFFETGLSIEAPPNLMTLDEILLDTISSYINHGFNALQYVSMGFQSSVRRIQRCIIFPLRPDIRYALSFAYKPQNCRGTAFFFCGMNHAGRNAIANKLRGVFENPWGAPYPSVFRAIHINDFRPGAARVFEGELAYSKSRRLNMFPFFQINTLCGDSMEDIILAFCCIGYSADGVHLKDAIKLLLQKRVQVFAFTVYWSESAVYVRIFC